MRENIIIRCPNCNSEDIYPSSELMSDDYYDIGYRCGNCNAFTSDEAANHYLQYGDPVAYWQIRGVARD